MTRDSPDKPFEVVFFDCDSTLSAVEGIDELARQAGVYDRIAPLTTLAMNGKLPLEEIYRQRLEIIRPSQTAIHQLGQLYVERLVPDARATIQQLLNQGKSVHIVSGGLQQAVEFVGEALGIIATHVHAVEVYFTPDGQYYGFDELTPLTRTGGKAVICQEVTQAEKRAAFVGDGITDLEAAEAGVYIIGFGGVVRRDIVVKNANVYVNGPSLLEVLAYL